jgi:hypothetical protein
MINKPRAPTNFRKLMLAWVIAIHINKQHSSRSIGGSVSGKIMTNRAYADFSITASKADNHRA